MNKLAVDVHGLNNFTDEQQKIFMEEVVPLLEKVSGSTEFASRLQTYSYDVYTTTGYLWWKKKTKKNIWGFKKAKGATNTEIFEKFMSGIDQFNIGADNDLDLFLTVYYSPKGVIGYTYPSTFKTWVNSKFFAYWLKSKTGHCKIVGNIIHEYMHNVGYGHDYRNNPTRRHTVPYAYGRIASEVARKLI